MGPCVRRHFRAPDAGEKTEVYQVFHKTPLGEEQGASHAGSTPKLVFTDAHSAFIECCSVRDVLIRDSVGSTHGMFHSQSCGRARKIPSVPRECMGVNAVALTHDLPTLVKVTFSLSLPAVPHTKQSWPPQHDLSFKVFNDRHLSMCFSCWTTWLFLIGRAPHVQMSTSERFYDLIFTSALTCNGRYFQVRKTVWTINLNNIFIWSMC